MDLMHDFKLRYNCLEHISGVTLAKHNALIATTRARASNMPQLECCCRLVSQLMHRQDFCQLMHLIVQKVSSRTMRHTDKARSSF